MVLKSWSNMGGRWDNSSDDPMTDIQRWGELLSKQKRYYHGGIPGLKKGDKILPPARTGRSTLLKYGREIDPKGVQREDRVYLTTDHRAAELFAATYPRGDVYKVVPDGDVEEDPDCLELGLSYQCQSATIKAVIRVGRRL